MLLLVDSITASVKIIPAYQIRQGERLVGAVGVCTPLILGHGAHHLAGDLADGGAVLRQVGLAAAGVGKQDLTHVAHHQRQRQLLRSIAVVAVALLFGRFVDALGRKAPAQDAAGLFYAKVAVQKGNSAPCVAFATMRGEERTTQASRTPRSLGRVCR